VIYKPQSINLNIVTPPDRYELLRHRKNKPWGMISAAESLAWIF